MRAIRRITTILVVFGLGLAAGLLPSLIGQANVPEEDRILYEPAMSVGSDPFTPPATSASGPFGGSGSDEVCDPELLVRFLLDHPDRLRAWADVQGIGPEDVPDFIRSLRPVVLSEDTRVTNHGFRDGRAYAIQSVLAKGTRVLVDKDGKPVVRCRCGNPLDKPKCKDKECDWPDRKCPDSLVALYGEDCVPDERKCPDSLVALYGEDCVPDERKCPEQSSSVHGYNDECDRPPCPQSSIHGYNEECTPPTQPPTGECPETSAVVADCRKEPGDKPQPEPEPEPVVEEDRVDEDEPDDRRPEPEDKETNPPSIVGP